MSVRTESGVMPIVNEYDNVEVTEVKFTGKDEVSGIMA